MSADNTQETSQTQSNTAQDKGQSDAFAEVKAQLAELARNQAATMDAVASVARSTARPAAAEVEENLYEPETLLRRAEQRAEAKILARETLQLKVMEMAKEYPEINSDTKIMNDVQAQLRNLPANLQQTPEGYEIAINRAASSNKLVPRSRRQTVDDDISVSNAGVDRRSSKKQKVTSEQLELAALLGMPADDPKYQERLEKQVNKRTDFKKWE